MHGMGSQDGRDPFRTLSPSVVSLLVLIGVIAIFGGCFIGFGMCFQPSWSVGWPGGSQTAIFSAGMTLLASLTLLALAFALSAKIGQFVQYLCELPYSGWITFGCVLVVSIVAILAIAPHLREEFRDWITPHSVKPVYR
jgi:hypothetical protein